jgi:hypothetical protein
MSKPKVSQVPESMLFDNTDDCFKAMPEDPAVPMVGVHDYDLLRADAEKLAEALDSLDQPICERIIDPCGYSPYDETKEELCVSMIALSMGNEDSLKVIRRALADFRKRWPKEGE